MNQATKLWGLTYLLPLMLFIGIAFFLGIGVGWIFAGTAYSVDVYMDTPATEADKVRMGYWYQVIVVYDGNLTPGTQPRLEIWVKRIGYDTGRLMPQGTGSNWNYAHTNFEFEGDHGRGPLVKNTYDLKVGKGSGPPNVMAKMKLIRMSNRPFTRAEVEMRFANP